MKKFVIAAVLLVALAMVPGVMAYDVDATTIVDSQSACFKCPEELKFNFTDVILTAANPTSTLEDTAVPGYVYSQDGGWGVAVSMGNDCKLCTSGTPPINLTNPLELSCGNGYEDPCDFDYGSASGYTPIPLIGKQKIEFGDAAGIYTGVVVYTFTSYVP